MSAHRDPINFMSVMVLFFQRNFNSSSPLQDVAGSSLEFQTACGCHVRPQVSVSFVSILKFKFCRFLCN